MLAMPLAHAAPTVIDDGTTGEGLSSLTRAGYTGSINPNGDDTLLAKTSQRAKFVWYAGSLQLSSDSYTISCDFKPFGKRSRCRIGLCGWLDITTKTGIGVYLRPGKGLCLRSYDFTVRGDPESTAHILNADGSGRKADVRTSGYSSAQWATLTMVFRPARINGLSAKCNVTLTQGAKTWSTIFYTNLPVPAAANHRFGYLGSYGAGTAMPAKVGYLDNLTLVESTGNPGGSSRAAADRPDPDWENNITTVLDAGAYKMEIVETPFAFRTIEKTTNKTIVVHSHTEFTIAGTDYTAANAINVQKTNTTFSADLTLTGSADTAHVELTVLPNQSVKIKLTNNAVGVTSINENFLDQGEEYYGVWEFAFGDKLSNRGVEYDLIGVTPGAHGMHSTNARAPFYMTSRSYAIYVDTLRLGRYAFAIDGKTRFEFDGHSLTYYLMHGKSYAALMQSHNDLAGSAFVPPDWALGTAWWRDDDYKHLGKIDPLTREPANTAQKNVQSIGNNLQFHKIPATTIWVDRPYGSSNGTSGSTTGWGNIDFDSGTKGFPDSTAMIRKLRGQGYHLMLWVANRCNGTLKTEAIANNYMFNIAGLSDPAADMRRPKAYSWFGNHLKTFANMGIHGYKIDRGHPQGETPRALENENVYLFTKMAAETQRGIFGDEAFVFARNAFDKSRGYIGIWNGDIHGNYAGLRDSIRDGLRCGAINYPIFGSDTPGLAGGRPSADLTNRWVQYSTYCTLMEINVGNGSADRSIWDTSLYPPWLLGAVRKQCQDHHDLIPYMRSCLYQATQTGMPVMRALIFEYPDEPDFTNKWDQYLFGPSILVAPVTEANVTSRSVDLPPGRWIDYNNKDTAYAGPSTITSAAPKDIIPLYVKEGAVIVRGDVFKGNNNWTPNWAPKLRIECFPARGIDQTFDYFDKTKVIPISASTTPAGVMTVKFGNLGIAGDVEVYCRSYFSVTRGGTLLTKGTHFQWSAADNVLTIPHSGATTLVIKGIEGLTQKLLSNAVDADSAPRGTP